MITVTGISIVIEDAITKYINKEFMSPEDLAIVESALRSRLRQIEILRDKSTKTIGIFHQQLLMPNR